MTDATRPGNSFSATATCAASTCKNQSAEWILSGQRPLPAMGLWTLKNAMVQAGTHAGTIKSFPDEEITMLGGPPTGPLNSAGSSFTV